MSNEEGGVSTMDVLLVKKRKEKKDLQGIYRGIEIDKANI